MNRPPYGLSLPANFVRAKDGDTIVVSFPGSCREWAIRLLDCWCPEVHGVDQAAGKAAKAFAEKLLETNTIISVWIPAPTDPIHLLSAVTFDRILGHIFLTDSDTLSEALVKHGHATKEKATP